MVQAYMKVNWLFLKNLKQMRVPVCSKLGGADIAQHVQFSSRSFATTLYTRAFPLEWKDLSACGVKINDNYKYL